MLQIILAIIIPIVIVYYFFGWAGIIIPIVGVIVYLIIRESRNPRQEASNYHASTASNIETIKQEIDNNNIIDSHEEYITEVDYDYTELDKIFDKLHGVFDTIKIGREPLTIFYKGSNGYKKRDIDITAVGYSKGPITIADIERTNENIGKHNYTVYGYCHFRNADRFFHCERIIHAFSNDKEINLVEYLVNICNQSVITNNYLEMADISRFLLSNNESAKEAAILAYIARLDGRFTAKEKDIILCYLGNKYKFNMNIKKLNPFMKEKLAEILPSAYEFKQSVKSITVTDDLVQQAKDIAKNDPMKLGAVEFLEKSLKSQQI